METFSRKEAYDESIALLKECSTKYGFKATTSTVANYSRIWGRDSMVCSIAALMSEDKDLIGQVKKSLKTLMKFQYKHGQIPSNVDVEKKKVSYGQSAGRVDAILWFLIGFGQYVKRTNDVKFLKEHYAHFQKAIDLVHLYEFNQRNFIYIPLSGDWADEYVEEGYILYDQLLYYQAIKEYIYLKNKLKKRVDHLKKKLKIVEKQINVNFWLDTKNKNAKEVYDKTVFNKALKEKKKKSQYLSAYFNPSGYGNQFSGFGNSLALNFGIIKNQKRKTLEEFENKTFANKTNYLIPAFYPAIKPKDKLWSKLINNYSIKFRNKPYEYHNGGLWPMITGFWAAGIARSDNETAIKYLDGINSANHKGKWGFYEFLNGKTFKPKGVKKQAWNAAGGVIAYETIINKKRPFL